MPSNLQQYKYLSLINSLDLISHPSSSTMTPMASLLILLLISSTTLSFVTAAADINWPLPLPYKFKHVCDEKRYTSLGLQMSQFPFCDRSLPYSVRAKHLIDSMTLTEKAQQLGNNADGRWLAVAKGVPRLGHPPYNWWADAKLMRGGTIRDQWNLHGYIVSDCDSIETMFETEQFLQDSL